jgi:hypothetical protein
VPGWALQISRQPASALRIIIRIRRKVFIGIKPYLLYNNQLYFQAEKEGDEKPNTKG